MTHFISSGFSFNLYNQTIEYIDYILSFICNTNYQKFMILFIFHYFVLPVFPISLLILYPNLKSHMIVSSIIISVFLLHHLYNGCIVLKLERKYMHNKKWFGIYHSLEYFGLKPKSNNIHYFFYGLMILILLAHLCAFMFC